MRIGTHLATATTLVIAAVTATLVVALDSYDRRETLESKKSAASMVTDLFAASVSPAVVFHDPDAIQRDLGNLRTTEGVVAAAVFPRDPSEDAEAFGPRLEPKQGVPVESSADHMIITRSVVDRDGQRVATVRVAFSLERENATMAAKRIWLALGGGIVILAVVALLAALTRRGVVRPLQELAIVAERIQRGDLGARTAPVGSDEIVALGRAFDAMGEAIAEREGRLKGELQVAADLQLSILPRVVSIAGADLSATMQPATEVGGDYYDIIPTRDGCWLGIGDVSGHGLGAGVVMLMVQAALAAVVRSNPDASPAEVECTVNGVLYENIRVRMGRRDHATLSILRYRRDGTIRFAGAHEDMIVYRAATGEVELVETPGTWVGAVADVSAATSDSQLELRRDDVLVLYTDGVTEAMRAKKQFGLDRLVEVVRGAAQGDAKAIRDAITAAVAGWTESPADDVSVVVLRHLGEPRREEATVAAVISKEGT
jgi:serine phosphatase RsbU (regulator of sigma subunit)